MKSKSLLDPKSLLPASCSGSGEVWLQPVSSKGSRRARQAARPPCFSAEGHSYPKHFTSLQGSQTKVPKPKETSCPCPGLSAGVSAWHAAGSLLLGTQKAITGRSSSFRALCAEGMAAYTSNVLTNSPTMPSGPLRSVNGITLAQPPLACLNFSLSRREKRTLVSKTLALKRTPVTD